jgi:hypothetical protein
MSMGFLRHGRCCEMSGRAAAPRWQIQKGVDRHDVRCDAAPWWVELLEEK